MENTELKNLQALANNIEKVIVGKADVIRLLITGILTNGHILLEDVPGVGKTMLSLALAKSIGGEFKRIQFTPDLLPSDVTGGMIYNPQKGEFEFKPGPVFANIILADEVNRTNPRTQSSLLECMQEFKVTIEGKTHPLKKPFMVIATQNPIEFQGTYPLPEAQIDRFLMKVNVGYLEPEEEVRVIKDQRKNHPIDSVEPILNLNTVNQLQDKVKEIEIADKIMEYIVNLVMATRNNENVKLGASPRASIALMNSARAWALLEGRDYVVPDDVVHLAFWVLRHRIVLQPKATMSGLSPKDVIDDILKKTPIS